MGQSVTEKTRKAFSIADVAEQYGLSLAFVRKQIRLGALSAARLGRRVVVPTESIAAWVQRGTKQAHSGKVPRE